MLKYSSIILLVAVAVFWSSADAYRAPIRRSLAVNSAPSYGARQLPYKRRSVGPYKRETEDSDLADISEETGEAIAKELLVGFLLLTAENSAERNTLEEKLKEAAAKNYVNFNDFATQIGKTYEQVTGRKLSESSESQE